jgi:hypothetical protein
MVLGAPKGLPPILVSFLFVLSSLARYTRDLLTALTISLAIALTLRRPKRLSHLFWAVLSHRRHRRCVLLTHAYASAYAFAYAQAYAFPFACPPSPLPAVHQIDLALEYCTLFELLSRFWEVTGRKSRLYSDDGFSTRWNDGCQIG